MKTIFNEIDEIEKRSLGQLKAYAKKNNALESIEYLSNSKLIADRCQSLRDNLNKELELYRKY